MWAGIHIERTSVLLYSLKHPRFPVVYFLSSAMSTSYVVTPACVDLFVSCSSEIFSSWVLLLLLRRTRLIGHA